MDEKFYGNLVSDYLQNKTDELICCFQLQNYETRILLIFIIAS